jgi:hypothetical protein
MLKKLSIIAAVAVMLAAATSAHAYYEWWEGWFNSGWLILSTPSPPRVDTFYYTTGQSTLVDCTDGDVDEFYVPSVTPSTFTCSTQGPYMGCYIKVWSNPSGSKDTGQEGQKEVNRGATWTGTAKLYQPGKDPEDFNVSGTWDTGTSIDDMYFDYDPETPTYSAHWVMNYSNPDGLTGEGGSAGELQ